jgi:hypothetical protein
MQARLKAVQPSIEGKTGAGRAIEVRSIHDQNDMPWNIGALAARVVASAHARIRSAVASASCC